MRRNVSISHLVITGVAFLCVLIVPVYAADDFGGDEGADAPVADNTDTAAVENLGPYGGDLWDVAVDTTNSVVYTVAKDSPNGFYKSTDGAQNWTGISGVDYGGGTAVEVDLATGAVYVMFSGGLYKSEDLGETFTQISENSGNGLLFANDTLVIGGTRTASTVSMSTDGGATFEDVQFSEAEDEYIWDIDYSADTDEFFIYSQEQSSNTNHLYRSADAGASWDEITLPTEVETVTEGRFAVNPLDGLNMIVTAGYAVNAFYSSDGGANWTEAGSASSGVTFDQTGRAWIAEQYSEDGGVTWESYDDDNHSSAIGGHNVTVDPSNENVVYADGMPGLAVSTDRGITWADSNEGILGVTISDISQAADKDIVWAAAYNGIAKTDNFTDEIPTWQFPVLEEPGFAIWTDPANPEVAVAGVINGTRRTTDGGVTWSEYAGTDLLESYEVFDEIINDINDTSILYAAISNNDPSSPKTGAVLRSTDQGITWEDLNLPDSGSAQTITQAPNGDLYVGLGAESDIDGETGIYKYSADTWEKLAGTPDQDIVKIIADPDDENSVYAIAGQLYNNGAEDTFGFYKTTDAGATWTNVTDGLGQLRNFTSMALQASTDPNTLYIGAENFYSQGVLFKSADAGETWALQYTGLQDETFYTMIFDGVTLGSSRGLFDIKSKADLSIKKGELLKKKNKQVIKATLKDAVTDKKLSQQKVRLMKKTNSGFKLIDTARTNNRGKVEFKVALKGKKSIKYKVQWNPKDEYLEEYVSATSDQVSVKAKK